ncbi:MAG: OsmC family protein [Bacteroidetes bacterium]|nr:OsmC family protein [Bacteroidota bacterium]
MENKSSDIHAHIEEQAYKTQLSNHRHEILADEPVENGGADLGFSPSDLLCASLAACTSITLRMYADRKEIALDEIEVDIWFEEGKEPGITKLHRKIELKGNISDEQKTRFLQIADKCHIHKVLTHPIQITSELA